MFLKVAKVKLKKKKNQFELFKKHKHRNSIFTKITFSDRRKPSLIEKMPAIPLTELHNGLVTVPEMKPRKFSSLCQAHHIASLFSKQRQFSVQDVSLVWKAYFESFQKSRSLG